MEKILESKALNYYENFYLIVSRDKKNFQSLKKSHIKSTNKMKNQLFKILLIFCNYLVNNCSNFDNTLVFMNETTTEDNYVIIKRCLKIIPDAASKCQKQYEEHMQFIERSQAIEDKVEKQLMFCCALWDWRHCVTKSAHHKCSQESLFAIDQFVPFIVGNRSETRTICSNFTSNDHNCTSISSWIIIAFIVVLLGLIFGLYYVFKSDRHHVFRTIKQMTVTESEEDNYEFIDKNLSAQKVNQHK